VQRVAQQRAEQLKNALLSQGGFNHGDHHLIRRKIRLGQFAGLGAMPLVIAFDRLERGGGLLGRCETQQSLAGRQHFRKAGILQDDGAAGREKGRASVAEPAGAQGNEYVLANAELSTGTADVVLVRLERPGDLLCVLNDPPRFIEVVQRGVARYRRGQLEPRTRRKI